MNHQPFTRIIPESNSVILFIHGILGSPDHFDFLIPMVSSRISVCNILLDGHGKGVRDFSRSSMGKWEAQVHEKVIQLSKTHQSIYIVAHSMGTLFAIDEAIHHPCVKALFLLAVPITPFPRLRMLSNAYKVYTGNIHPNDLHGLTSRAACSIQHDANFMAYLPWIKRYMELFGKVKQTRRLLTRLHKPCIAFQSRLDEMVAFRSADYLQKNSSINVQVLYHSWHNLYDPHDLQKIKTQFRCFLQNIK